MESLPKHIEHFMENSGRLFESKSHPCGAGRHPISELSIIDIAVRLPRMCHIEKVLHICYKTVRHAGFNALWEILSVSVCQ